MRVDSHHHFWRVDRRDFPWLTADAFPVLYRDHLPPDLAPFLTRHQIDRTIVVQGAQNVAETEFLLELTEQTPFVAGVVGWADFEAPDAANQIARLARYPKLLSLRPMLQNLADDAWILRPGIEPAVAALQASGLRLDVLIFPRHLPHAARFLAAHPDLPAVIDHGAKPYIARAEIEPWAAEMRAIAGETGVYCKLSGLVTEAGGEWSPAKLKPYVDVLIDAFGPDRLMWGSDWPMLNLAGGYSRWAEAADLLTRDLSTADRDEIFGGAAQRFYGIQST